MKFKNLGVIALFTISLNTVAQGASGGSGPGLGLDNLSSVIGGDSGAGGGPKLVSKELLSGNGKGGGGNGSGGGPGIIVRQA